MNGRLVSLLAVVLLTFATPAFASGMQKATREDWLYYLPVLGVIVVFVLLVNLAFTGVIIRRLRARRALTGGRR